MATTLFTWQKTDFWHSCTNTVLPQSLTDSETGIWRTPLRNKRKQQITLNVLKALQFTSAKSSYKSVQAQSHFKHRYVPYFLKLSLFGEHALLTLEAVNSVKINQFVSETVILHSSDAWPVVSWTLQTCTGKAGSGHSPPAPQRSTICPGWARVPPLL